MVIGLGIDLIELGRVRDVYDRFGERFLRRIFRQGEIDYCFAKSDPVPSLAGRFAVKEAAMKALGTGYSRGVWFRDIEVVRPPGSPPAIRFHGGAKARAESMGVTRALCTITHERNMGAAVVIFEGE